MRYTITNQIVSSAQSVPKRTKSLQKFEICKKKNQIKKTVIPYTITSRTLFSVNFEL
jgi:hypothetical protein